MNAHKCGSVFMTRPSRPFLFQIKLGAKISRLPVKCFDCVPVGPPGMLPNVCISKAMLKPGFGKDSRRHLGWVIIQ